MPGSVTTANLTVPTPYKHIAHVEEQTNQGEYDLEKNATLRMKPNPTEKTSIISFCAVGPSSFCIQANRSNYMYHKVQHTCTR